MTLMATSLAALQQLTGINAVRDRHWLLGRLNVGHGTCAPVHAVCASWSGCSARAGGAGARERQ